MLLTSVNRNKYKPVLADPSYSNVVKKKIADINRKILGYILANKDLR